jgi:hypothetical protein
LEKSAYKRNFWVRGTGSNGGIEEMHMGSEKCNYFCPSPNIITDCVVSVLTFLASANQGAGIESVSKVLKPMIR